MRNEELIALLQRHPPQATVWVLGGKGNSFGAITQVEIVTKETIGEDNKVSYTQVDIHLETNVP